MTNSSDTPIGASGDNQAGGSTVGSLRLAITDANPHPRHRDRVRRPARAVHDQPGDSLAVDRVPDHHRRVDPNGATASPFVTIVSNGGAFDSPVLQAGSDRSVIEGLSIEGFGGVGIDLMSGDDTIGGTTPGAGNVIFANLQGGVLIGVGKPAAAEPHRGQRGRRLVRPVRWDRHPRTSNTIDGNVISGNQGDGILIESSASSNLVEGNHIGTNPPGPFAWPTGLTGSASRGASMSSAVPPPGPPTRSRATANDGILITGDNATKNQVAGNLIGTNAPGNGGLANADDGVEVQTPSNTIGGPVGGAINTVAATTGGIQHHLG